MNFMDVMERPVTRISHNDDNVTPLRSVPKREYSSPEESVPMPSVQEELLAHYGDLLEFAHPRPFASGGQAELFLVRARKQLSPSVPEGTVMALKIALSMDDDNNPDFPPTRWEHQLLRYAENKGVPGTLRSFGVVDLPHYEGILTEYLDLDRIPTLRDLLNQRHEGKGSLTQWQNIMVVFSHLARIISDVWQEDIRHRDIKPDNIFVEVSTQELDSQPLRVILGDFGMAERIDEAAEEPYINQKPHGTPRYLSPERAKAFLHEDGEFTFDERSDVFSLAVIVYEMLTGQDVTPASDNMMAMLETWEQFNPLRNARGVTLTSEQFSNSIVNLQTRKVAEVFAKALSADPAQRYATCIEFFHAFEQAIEVGRKEEKEAEQRSQRMRKKIREILENSFLTKRRK